MKQRKSYIVAPCPIAEAVYERGGRVASGGDWKAKETKLAPAGGFTLIELLVVVAIIALLLGMLMNHLSSARDISMAMQCKNRLKSIGTSLDLYSKNHEGFLPVGYIDNEEGGSDGLHVSDWGLLVQSYLFGNAASTVEEFYERQNAKFSKIFLCPSATRSKGRLHFSGNHMLMPYESELRDGVFKLFKFSTISRSSEVVMVTDASQTQSGNANALLDMVINRMWIEENKPVYYNPDIEEHDQMIDPGPNTDRMPEGMGHIRFRHMKNTSAGVLFADLHVETRRTNELRNNNFLIDE